MCIFPLVKHLGGLLGRLVLGQVGLGQQPPAVLSSPNCSGSACSLLVDPPLKSLPHSPKTLPERSEERSQAPAENWLHLQAPIDNVDYEGLVSLGRRHGELDLDCAGCCHRRTLSWSRRLQGLNSNVYPGGVSPRSGVRQVEAVSN